MTPMKNPLGVSTSKGNQGATRGKEKILLTSVGIEPTTSGLDLPLLCRLSYEVGQRKSGTIKMVNRGEECYVTPKKNPLGVNLSKGNQGATRGKEKCCAV